MNNIKIFENDLPSEIDLSNEKVIGLDCEALGLVVGRDPLTLIQLGLKSKEFACFLDKKLSSEWLDNPRAYSLNEEGTKFYFKEDKRKIFLDFHHTCPEDYLVF